MTNCQCCGAEPRDWNDSPHVYMETASRERLTLEQENAYLKAQLEQADDSRGRWIDAWARIANQRDEARSRVALLEDLLREVMAEPEHVTLGWMDRANAALREKP